MKMFILSLAGMGLTIGGVYILYAYILSIDTQANILFLILSLVMIGAGIVVLVLAGKADTIILQRASKPEIPDKPAVAPLVKKEGFAGKLEENNKMLADWKKTNDTKQRLRMLEISAASDEK